MPNTFDWKNLGAAIRTYTDPDRWASPSGLWCAQFKYCCVVVQTVDYNPVEVWGLFLHTYCEIAADGLNEIESALWNLSGSPPCREFLGYNSEVTHDGVDYSSAWPLDVRVLLGPFIVCHESDGAFAVRLHNIKMTDRTVRSPWD